MPPENKKGQKSTYVKWGLTALLVIGGGVLLATILSDLDGFFAILKGFGKVLSPLAMGCVIAFLLNPLVNGVEKHLLRWLEKRMKKSGSAKKISRAVAIFSALIFAALIVYTFFAMLLPQLYESILGIVSNGEAYFRSIETWVNRLLEDNPNIRSYVDASLDRIYDMLSEWVSTSFLQDAQKLITTLTSSVKAVLGWVMNLIIGLVASVYILWSKDVFKAQAKKIALALLKPQTADHLFYLGRETKKIFNGFVNGKLIDSAIVGLICYVGVLILKMPYPALLATVIGVTNVIPFFGPFIGAIPCALLILLVDPMKAVYFVIFIICLQQLDGNVIGPKILGDTVGISGFWVLISITVASGLFGFAGMLLGVPVFAVIYLIINDAVRHALEKKGLSPETKDYQQLTWAADAIVQGGEETE